MWKATRQVVVPLTCWCYVVTELLVAGVTAQVTSRNDQSESDKLIFPNDFLLYARNYEHHHNHYHQGSYPAFPPDFRHSPEFHKNDGLFQMKNGDGQGTATNQRGNGGQADSVPPPVHKETGNDAADRREGSANNNGSLQLPLELAQKINEHNISDLMLNYFEEESKDAPVLLNRFGDGAARSVAIVPKPAGCIPERTVVKLANSTDPSVLYIPECTRIERCGGCCSHSLLSCQPIESEIVPFQVRKAQYTGSNRLKLMAKEVVYIEKHTRCKCDCKVKEKDCNKYQEYSEPECRCACINTEEEKQCYNKTPVKLWNPEICACQCRNTSECTTGYIFDQNECRCVPATLRRINPGQVVQAP